MRHHIRSTIRMSLFHLRSRVLRASLLFLLQEKVKLLQQEEVLLMEQVKEVKATLAEEDSRLRVLKEKVDVCMFRLKVCRLLRQCDSRRHHLLVAGV